jgi:hypothetical protein
MGRKGDVGKKSSKRIFRRQRPYVRGMKWMKRIMQILNEGELSKPNISIISTYPNSLNL